MAADTSRISPTAHYTGHVWYRNGLSHQHFRTAAGHLIYHAAEPLMQVTKRVAGLTVEDMLLTRHATIDRLLTEHIERNQISQVVEIAAGLSPRGLRFMKRYGHQGLVYVESDLPAMVAKKREVLGRVGSLAPGHHVVTINALANSGPGSLTAEAAPLINPHAGTAIITEGLLNYLPPAWVQAMWQQFARFLAPFPYGLYLSDLHLDNEIRQMPGAHLLSLLISVVARGRAQGHFTDPPAAEAGILNAGFASAAVARPEDYGPIDPAWAAGRRAPLRIICARTASAMARVDMPEP